MFKYRLELKLLGQDALKFVEKILFVTKKYFFDFYF